jgi:hypothetical protein
MWRSPYIVRWQPLRSGSLLASAALWIGIDISWTSLHGPLPSLLASKIAVPTNMCRPDQRCRDGGRAANLNAAGGRCLSSAHCRLSRGSIVAGYDRYRAVELCRELKDDDDEIRRAGAPQSPSIPAGALQASRAALPLKVDFSRPDRLAETTMRSMHRPNKVACRMGVSR